MLAPLWIKEVSENITVPFLPVTLNGDKSFSLQNRSTSLSSYLVAFPIPSLVDKSYWLEEGRNKYGPFSSSTSDR